MKCSVLEKSHGDAELLKPYIEGKRVWDIGAGDGEFAEMLSKHSKVTCIELEPVYAGICRSRGLETIQSDFESLKPDCTVIYAFLSFVGNYKLSRWIERNDWHGTVISQYYPLGTDPTNFLKPYKIVHSELPFLIYIV